MKKFKISKEDYLNIRHNPPIGFIKSEQIGNQYFVWLREVWRAVINYRGYEISSFGRLRSNKKTQPTNRILKESGNGKGYVRYGLSMNNKRKGIFAHRLVADAFLGKSKLGVNHKNGIKNQNVIHNIEYATCRENSRHYFKSKRELPVGITRVKNQFRAGISLKDKQISFGLFKSQQEAELAYRIGNKIFERLQEIHSKDKNN